MGKVNVWKAKLSGVSLEKICIIYQAMQAEMALYMGKTHHENATMDMQRFWKERNLWLYNYMWSAIAPQAKAHFTIPKESKLSAYALWTVIEDNLTTILLFVHTRCSYPPSNRPPQVIEVIEDDSEEIPQEDQEKVCQALAQQAEGSPNVSRVDVCMISTTGVDLADEVKERLHKDLPHDLALGKVFRKASGMDQYHSFTVRDGL
ncbi:hypothetical protein EMPG_12121 [Blastomyces silverae]|uniref:Uncharacterized protein n=1 Tax=Blastomyces silverae TaxID=2060906 RepID=A0A0H1BNJ2_9EURO|nr:hypothetical protein EMPG_12121 [Blastomyces silverae]